MRKNIKRRRDVDLTPTFLRVVNRHVNFIFNVIRSNFSFLTVFTFVDKLWSVDVGFHLNWKIDNVEPSGNFQVGFQAKQNFFSSISTSIFELILNVSSEIYSCISLNASTVSFFKLATLPRIKASMHKKKINCMLYIPNCIRFCVLKAHF